MSDVLVLCYHGVSQTWPADISIEPERLERQLHELLERGYTPTTFTAAVTAPPAARTLSVTFDDGFRSVLRHGLPILRRLGIAGTMFVPSRLVGSADPVGWEGTDQWLGGPHASELELMGWDELDELASAGWELGSHTCTHPKLPALGDVALEAELRDSKGDMEEHLGRPCTSIAYPYGLQDPRVAAAAARAGYLAGGGLLPDRLSRRTPLAYPRVMVARGYDAATLRRRQRPAVRRLQGSRAWPAVAAGVQSRLRAAKLIDSARRRVRGS
jgi:peptidoglycan/xylan/chitin deacetylase (PgdA/CDA1 family)